MDIKITNYTLSGSEPEVEMTNIKTRTCPVCQTFENLVVEQSEVRAWRNGASVQDAFPNMSIENRELLISGIHGGTCFDKYLMV